MSHWRFPDWVVLAYTLLTGLLIAALAGRVEPWPYLLAARALILAALFLLPGPIAKLARSQGRKRPRLVGTVLFLRFAYPIFLIFFFFEEVHHTVNILYPNNPFWFEPYLYAADRALFFGALPAVLLAPTVNAFWSEFWHLAYITYYPIIAIGLLAGRKLKPVQARGRDGAPTTLEVASGCMTLAYLSNFILFLLVPGRAPWENPSLLARLPSFEGPAFTPFTEWLIGKAGVSGGCFPSSHVSGSWGLIAGLSAGRPKTACALSAVAVLMNIGCVYTRYHHAADVLAGAALGLGAGYLGRKLALRRAEAL